MCGVYYWLLSWFMTNIGYEGFERPIWTAFWIHIGLKILFITLQDINAWYHFLKFAIELVLIIIFAPDVIMIILFCMIFFPVAFAWSNLTLASNLATGKGPLAVRAALNRAVTPKEKPWSY